MKKLKIKLLLIVLMSTVPNLAFAHDIEVKNSDGVTIYYLFSNRGINVTFRGSTYNSYEDEYTGFVKIPDKVTYNGTIYTVEGIDTEAFSDCSSLTSIEIPNSMTIIGDYAF